MDYVVILGLIIVLNCINESICYAPVDIIQDDKARQIHELDSLNILSYTFLLILTVLTIWLFKTRRARYLHETGLAVVYGLIVGCVLRYVGDTKANYSHVKVSPLPHQISGNETAPWDSVWVPFTVVEKSGPKNKTYVYVFRGELANVAHEISQKATFDPEIFFNIILPPIIFNAGYSLKRRFFFRNLGAIMTYAFFGTTISCFVVALILYGLMLLIPKYGFTFADCLYFGATISATDPVTVLAIFSDLRVDVTLYALVFGESILNDAVAIVLAGSVNTFEDHYLTGGLNPFSAAGKAISNFVYIFFSSLFLGSFVGCFTALTTKFTRLCDFPLLETCLVVLMSYTAFLLSEVLGLSGIVAVLFCGICQAHYTYNNLSKESRDRSKQLFELLSFMAENFIFTYLGVSMFTYPTHKWSIGFILVAFIAIILGRALHVYPLTFILNLGRNNKIPLNYQHVIFFAGLRGAMAYALAVRNTLSEPRQIMLTTTSVISICTVIACGGFTSSVLQLLEIPVGVEETEHEMLPFSDVKRSNSVTTPIELQSPTSPSNGLPGPGQPASRSPYEKAWLVRKWYNFDVRYMKPLLTHSRPTLMDTLPDCCLPLSRLLTTTQQLTADEISSHKRINPNYEYDSDDDYVLTRDTRTTGIHFAAPKSLGSGLGTSSGPNIREGSSTQRSSPGGTRVGYNNQPNCDYVLDDKCIVDFDNNGCVSHLPSVPNYNSLTRPSTRDSNLLDGPSNISGDNFI